MQPDAQHGRAAAAALEMGFQRLQEPAEHTRQRLQPLDGPLEFERLLEALLWNDREKRPRILAARTALPPHTCLSEPRGHGRRGQCRDLAESAKTPATERGKHGNSREGDRERTRARGRGGGRLVMRENRQPLNRQRCERGCFGAWVDHRDRLAGGTGKQPCGGACARNGHAHAQSAIGSGPTQCLAHRARIAKQPRHTAEVKDNLPGRRSASPCSAGPDSADLRSIESLAPCNIQGTWSVNFDSRRELARDLHHDVDRAPVNRVHSAKHPSSFTATLSPRPSRPHRPVVSARRRAWPRPDR